MTIYTKKGDKGETSLPSTRRISKTEQIFEVLGNLDYTNATIGLAISQLEEKKFDKLIEHLHQIQQTLLAIGACIASPQPPTTGILKRLPDMVGEFEQQIDNWETLLPPLKNFILPGGSPAGAALHLTRTATRQTERYYHRLVTPEKLNPIAIYLNRLSDFFFQAARWVNFQTASPEAIWTINQEN